MNGSMGMDHSMHGHSTMNHSTMNNSMMNHSMMNHSMNHTMNHADVNLNNHGIHVDDGTDGGHGSPAGHSTGHDMKMYFNGDYGSIYEVFVLFYQWRISSPGELAAACVGLFVLAALYEGLKVGRDILARKQNIADMLNHKASVPMSDIKVGNSTASMTAIIRDGKSNGQKRASPFNTVHIVQSLLHILQVTVSYILMLVIMTFNVYMCLSIVLGAGAGYFAFAWKKRSSSSLQDNNEHCN